MIQNIEPVIENGDPINRYILSKKIKLVCSKVGFKYDNIKWNIYDNNMQKKLEPWNKMNSKNPYGYCIPKEKRIYISTQSIKYEMSRPEKFQIIMKCMNVKKKQDLLADVILDEIAHIITNKGHESVEYKETLNRLRHIYYDKFLY